MSGFTKVLRCFLVETFIRSGLSVVERDFRDTLQWKGEEFRDDDDIDEIEREVKKVAREYADTIVDSLLEQGFKSENDILVRKEDLSNIVKHFIEDFESELRGGVPQ